CEDEAYRLLKDEFRRISIELDKAPQSQPATVAQSPMDVFANKVKGAVREATGDHHKTTAKAAEKHIDSIFGALKKTIRGIVASEKASRSKDEPQNAVLDKVIGALSHVVSEEPSTPLPMGIGDRIARNESRVFEAFVPKQFRKQAIYILNKQPQFSYIRGHLYRPTARAPQRRTVADKVIWEILESYFYMQYYQSDLLSYIKESNVREIPDSPGYGKWWLSPLPAGSDLIAAAIDLNDTKTIDLIKAILTGQFGLRDGHTGEPCPYSISPDIVRGIVKSDNEEIIQQLIAFMMDAGLQEGVRQCVCENMDAGTLKAQIMIFRAIYENHLIRFSSVKRGLATQIGFPDSDSFDLERISEQVVESMHEVIEHPKSCYDYIRSSDDHLKVNMGFWGLGIRDVQDIADEVDWLLKNGTHEQIKYASHNVFVIKDEGKLMSYAKYIFDHYSDDPEMLSRWLRCFIYDDFGIVDIALYSKGIQDRGRWWEKVRFKCDPIPLEPYFQSEEEAREYYHKLRTALAHFDQYDKENAIYKLFIIAWMLQDVELL
ncbi:MAG: hypothetical protein II180_04505, partial [Proteobacteria bacterium]|nr:hypothetical protein [Pseudomonadota bacterium]